MQGLIKHTYICTVTTPVSRTGDYVKMTISIAMF